jgi:hypothetical protein
MVAACGYQGDDCYKQYQVDNGMIVCCKEYSKDSCGVNLSDCNSGQEYECLENVTVIRGDSCWAY